MEASKTDGASKVVSESLAFLQYINKARTKAVNEAELQAAQFTINSEGVILPPLPEKLELKTPVSLGNGNYSTVWRLVKEQNWRIDNWVLFLHFNKFFPESSSIDAKVGILEKMFQNIRSYIPKLDLRKIVELEETLMNVSGKILVNVKDILSLSCVLELGDHRMKELKRIVLSTEDTGDTDKVEQFSTTLVGYENQGGSTPIRIVGELRLPPAAGKQFAKEERQKSIKGYIKINIPIIFANKTEIIREQWALLNVSENKSLFRLLIRRDLKDKTREIRFLSTLKGLIANNPITFDEFLELYKKVPYQLSSDINFLIGKRKEIESTVATMKEVSLDLVAPQNPIIQVAQVEPEPQVETRQGAELVSIFPYITRISKLECTDYTDFLDKLWEKTVKTYNAQQVAAVRAESKNQQELVMEQKNAIKANQVAANIEAA